MTIRIALNHRTEYRYDARIALSPHMVRLRPAPHCRTPVLSYSLKVEPREHFINWQQDPFGNWVARYVFPEKTDRLSFEVDLVAEMTVINPFDFFLEESARNYPFTYDRQLAKDLAPYFSVEESGPLLSEWLAGVDRSERDTTSFLVGLNQSVQRRVGYVIRMEAGVQSCEQTISSGLGSCRDSGWLLVQMLRHLGFAARFVSGYLVQLAPDQKALDGPSGPEHDFTDLHAWAEVFVPGAGWIGLDATSGLLAGEGHIPLCCTPDPQSAAPVTGYTEPAKSKFYYHNRVERVHEDPRVTRPYGEAQWQRIMALGERVDADLAEGDVRLTMGGEPTFVSIDDMDGAEWNTAALGDDKRRLADLLFRRLRRRFAPGGGLEHRGQGKWYPGEPLPRWAMSCFWRADGKPVWRDERWLADESRDYGHGDEEAARFVRALAATLGIPASRAVPGYEDVYYTLWREGTLPDNVDPFEAELADPLERHRLLAQLEGGLDRVAGYALPLRRNPLDDAEPPSQSPWQSSRWSFRRGRMYLVPGDSPMGLRLPLASLPWVAPADREAVHERDPFDEHAALAERYAPPGKVGDSVGAAHASDAPEVLHTALCVQARAGRLHVFLPPLGRLEHFLELVTAVEMAAEAEQTPVVLEGYEPPRDPRVELLQVTPDPGVIEVNIHPSTSWKDLVEKTEILYDEARSTRLGTEKFNLDGRHTGTGGGNHVTLGGPSAAESPFLRRPQLLASLITYWQHHPSLSYLFSGAFIGPTSQAPRVDEARDDNVHELEIALAELPRGESPAPWLVDRTLRHLLVDLTGNTHRAEFCIDKLYSPDGTSGRRGLVEFRAFEMPPHPRMSLVQMLLLRTLIARFWEEPYRKRLVRWGTELHDRFMLPHFIVQDLHHVVEDLRDAGYPFESEWFAPFVEFRFPVFGTVTVDGVELELRWALEPWHVLGEELTGGGTARYVDSSVERVQVKLRGLLPQRHLLACNGRRVPLHGTGTRGEYVAGVRYKAWNPHSALHPTIDAHTPLVFDLVDILAGRSLGGCTYHVGHPAGRNYETFPVNANEAEARRVARFWPYGHTPGPMTPPAEERSPDFPFTLDLRRARSSS
ncbi:MAG: transglutaminase family protein [Gammaproteobacteria bacterium]|nr:transglutaminase family protein [Gammaproteobacteria bacterium]